MLHRYEGIGYIGRDALVRDVNGQSVINFSVGVTHKFVDRSTGEEKQNTYWVECSWWRDNDKVNIANYLKSGTQVMVSGFPTTEVQEYTDKNNQKQTKAAFKVNVKDVQLLGSSKDKTDDAKEEQKITSKQLADMKAILQGEHPKYNPASIGEQKVQQYKEILQSHGVEFFIDEGKEAEYDDLPF